MKRLRRRTALITGASSGMGIEYARQLAAMGANLILTARREQALEALQQELEPTGVQITTIPHDLGQSGSAALLWNTIREKNLTVDILVNNAGYGAFGAFDEIAMDKEESMLRLDIISLVQLTRLVAVEMKKRGWGRILQVASVAAYQPAPLFASYAAAKAFVLNYSIAIHNELRGTGVSCTVLSPGVTRTGFFDAADMQQLSLFQRATMMSSQRAVRIGIRAMLKKRSAVVPGVINSLLVFTNRFVGRGMSAAIAKKMMTV